jgi:two-component system response regulator ChvI
MMMNDGKERVTGWPRLTLAQSAQDVWKLGPSAISEYRCAKTKSTEGDFGSVAGVVVHLRRQVPRTLGFGEPLTVPPLSKD